MTPLPRVVARRGARFVAGCAHVVARCDRASCWEALSVGVVLEVPAEASPWSVEVRSRSSYVYAVGLPFGFPAVRSAVDARRASLTLEREHLVPLGVACSVLLARPELASYQKDRGVFEAVSIGRTHVVVRGPAHVYFIDADVQRGGMAGTIEVAHEDLASLRDTVLAACPARAGAVPPAPR